MPTLYFFMQCVRSSNSAYRQKKPRRRLSERLPDLREQLGKSLVNYGRPVSRGYVGSQSSLGNHLHFRLRLIHFLDENGDILAIACKAHTTLSQNVAFLLVISHNLWSAATQCFDRFRYRVSHRVKRTRISVDQAFSLAVSRIGNCRASGPEKQKSDRQRQNPNGCRFHFNYLLFDGGRATLSARSGSVK